MKRSETHSSDFLRLFIKGLGKRSHCSIPSQHSLKFLCSTLYFYHLNPLGFAVLFMHIIHGIGGCVCNFVVENGAVAPGGNGALLKREEIDSLRANASALSEKSDV